MDDLEYIKALMASATNAVGFIPDTTLQARYIAQEQYAIQRNPYGVPVGYILHGNPKPGRILSITQTLIELDKRQNGYGFDAINTVIARAQRANCRAIKATVAEDLLCDGFWIAAGFHAVRVLPPDNTRNRSKTVYLLDLWPTLLETLNEQHTNTR